MTHYISKNQINWVLFLPLAQLALNAQKSDTTKKSLFFANFGKNPNLFLPGRENQSAQAAIERVETLKRIYESILQMQRQSVDYQNTKQKTMPQLKKRDKVYLRTANIKTKRPSKKVDHV